VGRKEGKGKKILRLAKRNKRNPETKKTDQFGNQSFTKGRSLHSGRAFLYYHRRLEFRKGLDREKSLIRKRGGARLSGTIASSEKAFSGGRVNHPSLKGYRVGG